METHTRHLTWRQFTWLAGLAIVSIVLLLFVVSFFSGLPLDASVSWAFLGIGSALMGIGPSRMFGRKPTNSHSGDSE